MKVWARGKTVQLREVVPGDAAFIYGLRRDPELGRHLSPTPGGVEAQKAYLEAYAKKEDEFYFIITTLAKEPLGAIRLYDVRGDSFCWGSWILRRGAPYGASVESLLLLFDFAFFSQHYARTHFDVRKANTRVASFYLKLGARVVREDELNLYLDYDRARYLETRRKYAKLLP